MHYAAKISESQKVSVRLISEGRVTYCNCDYDCYYYDGVCPCRQVELQRALHQLDSREHMLDTSHRTIEKQEATLHTIESELNDREQENYLLRKSVDITK